MGTNVVMNEANDGATKATDALVESKEENATSKVAKEVAKVTHETTSKPNDLTKEAAQGTKVKKATEEIKEPTTRDTRTNILHYFASFKTSLPSKTSHPTKTSLPSKTSLWQSVVRNNKHPSHQYPSHIDSHYKHFGPLRFLQDIASFKTSLWQPNTRIHQRQSQGSISRPIQHKRQ